MSDKNKPGNFFFWGGLITTLGLWYLAASHLYDLIMIINSHTKGIEAKTSELGLSFGLTTLFAVSAYYVSQWYSPILTAHSPTDESTVPPKDRVDIAQIGDLSKFTENQWRRILPDPTGYVSGCHELYSKAWKLLDPAIIAFHSGGSSATVNLALDKANPIINQLKMLDLSDTLYADNAKYLSQKYQQIKSAVTLITEAEQLSSFNEKRLQILSAENEAITEYSVSSIEGDGKLDPVLLEENLENDPRIFGTNYTCGRQYTTGGYSDDHPEVSTFTFRCLTEDYESLKQICDDLLRADKPVE